ncbi:hypothetical protein [Niveibacterium sp. COAC-50]|uniref:hypothetical protein n=1 Tax=Niveibacterium sp. COAC-50 TaxID=2729384 RepID=UPI0015581308|nr:hypothetical protein [Niveibacterium sp. COAC-50]
MDREPRRYFVNGIETLDASYLGITDLKQLKEVFGVTSTQFDGNLSLRGNPLSSLIGIEDIADEIRGYLDLRDCEIRKGGLGLLLIKGLKSLRLSNTTDKQAPALAIIAEYLGKDDIYGCQNELIEKHFADFAEL